jgi:hypothetical protein
MGLFLESEKTNGFALCLHTSRWLSLWVSHNRFCVCSDGWLRDVLVCRLLSVRRAHSSQSLLNYFFQQFEPFCNRWMQWRTRSRHSKRTTTAIAMVTKWVFHSVVQKDKYILAILIHHVRVFGHDVCAGGPYVVLCCEDPIKLALMALDQ